MSARRQRATFRRHLMLTSAASVAVFAALVGASLFVPLVAQLDRTDMDRQMLGGIAEQVLFLHRSFWPVVIGSLVASVVSATVLYQRMTGPVIRFVHAFQQISRGAFPGAIELRWSDYLTEEADALNAMIEALRRRASEREAASARCRELLDELTALVPDGEEERPILDALQKALQDLR